MWTFSQRSAHRSDIWHQLYRFCSSKSKKHILRTRFEQKQLFGGVITDESTIEPDNKAETMPPIDDCRPINTAIRGRSMVTDKLDASESNEFHWLIQRQQNSKYVKVFSIPKKVSAKRTTKTKKKLENLSLTIDEHGIENDQEKPTNGDDIARISPASAQSVIRSAQNLLNDFIISNRTNTESMQQTLFDDNSLKLITNYPIMRDKLAESKVNNILADTAVRLPSISKVLQATMPESSRIALQKWKLAKIAELGIVGFKQYEQETLQIGRQFHSAIEDYLESGSEPDIESPVRKLWQSLGSHLKEMKPNPVLIEKQVVHADLKYKGIIDNVSVINDEMCALEWKTSEKTKPKLYSTYDAPVQLCAYIGALNVDPRYDVKVQNGYVIVAYKNGDKADIFRLSPTEIRKYWSVWLQRLQEYWIRVRDGTLPEPI